MKKFFPLPIVLLTISSCIVQKPVSSSKPNNNQDYTVKYLFEYGGCKVYRFQDGGQMVYFTNCSGETISKTDSTELKNTIRSSQH